MNAYEIADELDGRLDHKAANMLRKQADHIAELSKNVDELEEELLKAQQIKELNDEEIKPLLDRIQNYLECGGLFNPECMEHDKVKDLIMDCRAILKKASEKWN